MQSIRKPTFTEIVKAIQVANEWTFNPSDILNSPRKVKGKFHTPKIDKDNEYIEKTAVQTAVPDFMHLPILHDFHKERTVGIVTRVVELSDGSFDFEGLIKATDDCNDIWELIAKGNYNQVSIYGKRTCGSSSCSVKPEQRTEPCVTTGVRLDSISVCDDNARNDGTSLMVAKGAKVVFNATEEIIKAETTDSSLMHEVTDYPRTFGKDGLPRIKKKCTATCPQYERNDLGKGDVMDVTEKSMKNIENPMEGSPNPRGKEKPRGKFDSMGRNYRPPVEKGAEESEDKLDTLINLVEQLVQKDITEKGTPYDNNYSDKSPDVGSAPESADQGRELPPEEQRECGTPEEKAAGDFSTAGQRAASKLDQSAVAAQGQTRAADPSVDITEFASNYHLKKKAESDKQKEAFIQNEPPRPSSAEVPGEEKAKNPGSMEKEPAAPLERDFESKEQRKKNLAAEAAPHPIPKDDPHRPPEAYDPEVGYEKQSTLEAPTQTWTRDAAATPPMAAQKKQKNPAEYDEGQRKKNPEAAATGKQAKESEPKPKRPEAITSDVKPGEPPVKEVTEGTNRGKTENNRPDYKGASGNKTFEPKTEVGQKFKGEVESMGFDKKKGEEVKTPPKPTAEGSRREESSSDTRTTYEEEKGSIHNEGEDKNEMPDIDSRIDRLIQVISQLVQSDEQVHQKMDNPKTEEEKASISKGTETMKDEEVDTLVKAKVAAEVEAISKAYQAQVDELKSRLDKMEKETIEKSGVVVVMREGDENVGTPYLTNAAAVSAAKKVKVA